MAELHQVLVTVPFPDEKKRQLEQALGPARVIYADRNDREGIGNALREADAAILAGDVNDLILTGERLEWVHCDLSGLTNSARQEVFDRGLRVTGSAGRTAPALSEHVLLFMLALAYDMPALLECQKKHQWGGIPGYQDRRGLVGHTAGIIGVGHTGAVLARYLKTMGMTTLGYRRKAEAVEGIDEMYCADRGDTIDALLERSDYLILTVQLSDETYHLIGEKELRKMKPTACLINLCRGSVVDEQALVRALNAGIIAGAGVDTTEVEPLPAYSPLWDARNVLITPHTTPTVPDRLQNSLDIICENIRRYRADEPLLNQLTPRDVYTRR